MAQLNIIGYTGKTLLKEKNTKNNLKAHRRNRLLGNSKDRSYSTDLISFCGRTRGFGEGVDTVGRKYFGFI